MEINQLKELLNVLREEGVTYYKTPELTLYLGPARATAASDAEDEERAAFSGNAYDNPLLWKGGNRPTVD